MLIPTRPITSDSGTSEGSDTAASTCHSDATTAPVSNAAVLLDFENIRIGLERHSSHLPSTPADLAVALDRALQIQGMRVAVARAYVRRDLPSARQVQEGFEAHGYEVVLVAPKASGKDRTDMSLSADGIHFLYQRSDIGVFIIASGDGDFEALALSILASGKRVFIAAAQGTVSRDLAKRAERVIWFEEALIEHRQIKEGAGVGFNAQPLVAVRQCSAPDISS